MEIQPQAPKMVFFKKIHFFENVSRFRFQRALNHPQTLTLIRAGSKTDGLVSGFA